MFEAVPEAEVDADPAARLLTVSSEEGQKVARNGGATFRAVFRRRADGASLGAAGAGAAAEAGA